MTILPGHVSYSSFSTWLECGWKYWLTRVENIKEPNTVYLTGGTAVHYATELYDHARIAGNDIDLDTLWNTAWSHILEIDSAIHGDPNDWFWIKSEKLEWWYTEGREMLGRWHELAEYGWRVKDNLIEHKMRIPIESTTVDMAVDRVMVDPEGSTVLVDIKTGASSQKHPMQLAVYAWALGKNGIKVDKAGFWEARTGNLTIWNIEHLHPERVEQIFNDFDKARQQNIFIPNFNNCARCGVLSSCKWLSK